MRGLLHRAGDEPSPDEERALEIMKGRETAKLDEIDGRLARSSKRSRAYGADLPKQADNLRVERRAQDRILDERRAAMGLIGGHG